MGKINLLLQQDSPEALAEILQSHQARHLVPQVSNEAYKFVIGPKIHLAAPTKCFHFLSPRKTAWCCLESNAPLGRLVRDAWRRVDSHQMFVKPSTSSLSANPSLVKDRCATCRG